MIVVRRMQQADTGEFLRCLAQALGQQRMVLAQEAADHQYAVELLDVGNGHAEPRHDILAVERKVSLAETAVDAIAAGATHEFL